jgi:hypothetical protein
MGFGNGHAFILGTYGFSIYYILLVSVVVGCTWVLGMGMHLFLGHGFSVCYLLVSVVVWCTWVLGMGMHWFLRHGF